MVLNLLTLTAVCTLSLLYILVIPYFARTEFLMLFLPRDIREAPPAGTPILPPAGGFSDIC